MVQKSTFATIVTLVFLLSHSTFLLAQTQSRCDSSLVVSGWVFESGGGIIPSAMAVNRQSGGGVFVERDGSFLVRACPGDTLVFGAIGFYSVEKRVVSAMRSVDFKIELQRLKVDVGVAEVYAPRALRQILNDIESLGYSEKDFRVSGVNALQSPITFLYEQFSRREQSRRLEEELINNDTRRELLQELFVKYVDYDIVQLKQDEFEAFAKFCDPGDAMLKKWTQYEFILYVKRQYGIFRMLPSRLDEGDYRYDLD
ncbi:MAG: hypothetical protein COA49_01670 [Bacteroidetes bacterium]|nr:MAG: hypothetical protein COA49_01670 [Bacteroidota bacterium]